METFCEDLKLTCCEAVYVFKAKADSQIDSITKDATDLSSILNKINEDLLEFKEYPEAFISITKLANCHKEIVAMDKKLTSLKNSLKLLTTEHSRNDAVQIRSHMEKMLQYHEQVTSQNTTEIIVENGNYTPGFLKAVLTAVVQNDIGAIKRILENPNMPRKAMKYILNYQFHSAIDKPGSERCQKNSSEMSMLTLASIYNRVEIIRYLFGLDGFDALDRYSGKTVVHHLLNAKNVSSDIEVVVEELLEKEPNLVSLEDSDGQTIFQSAIIAGSAKICRFLVLKFGEALDDQFEDGTTPLILAIRIKCKMVFDELLSLGASLEVKTGNGYSCLHEACEVEWLEAICAIIKYDVLMVNMEDGYGISPLDIIIENDSLDTLLVVEECMRKAPDPLYLTKDFVHSRATEMSAHKILAWSSTFQFKF